ncbi:MAG: hypothetical protein A2654_00190 [Candidatus Nealsonbacteria bacterium RIFCSPHIGHO2_01_FULL_43_31]|uniref:DUF1573 domain-containing protein n=2 Tax=Candidatus Nealsoniibacteriota TaxID=1817911 RepID=A0A1G2E6L8_9BACT|nr:MAG: hypothetical protein UV98_C0035G0010 [Parcubacteria group bacterium GW2011_GWB1_43_6]OGZ19822.1 MAG: hypothetical protein A2654_00190 [Candidatus Nealsonbacteria bacterium RIFCSPHIGHO2_01_FULL_43_31]OGZ21503.1 MAG: hypothetical protein A3D46_00035 [Candidatus Nealsonbacteria bacterium RIFCSPHIGHO2_02_FULL_43_13]OGZ24779.1 MAG: hypothetical protein A2922_00755 [Candidatus Nealsonbacteria bacterium RIFCSPLOWO2_01_FULL_43_36]
MNTRKITLILVVLSVLSLIVSADLILTPRNNGSPLVQSVSAQEIYPMFLCPCCGKPLDPQNICCGMAKEMIDYIDSLVAQNLSEKEIISTYIKKYGLNSFVDKNEQEEFKEELVKTAPIDRPIISLAPGTLDLGNISQKGGIVTTLFELKNEGKKDLTIDRLDSSCGCTSAAVVFEGQEGPRFAMAGHGIESPQDWKLTIPAGKSAQLKVYYDPSVHQDLRGAVTREIYIYSNDPINFEQKVTIELNQVD